MSAGDGRTGWPSPGNPIDDKLTPEERAGQVEIRGERMAELETIGKIQRPPPQPIIEVPSELPTAERLRLVVMQARAAGVTDEKVIGIPLGELAEILWPKLIVVPGRGGV